MRRRVKSKGSERFANLTHHTRLVGTVMRAKEKCKRIDCEPGSKERGKGRGEGEGSEEAARQIVSCHINKQKAKIHVLRIKKRVFFFYLFSPHACF